MRRTLAAIPLIATLMATACSTREGMPIAGSTGAGAEAAAGPHRPGIRFDPTTAKRGDRIGVLVLDSISIRRTVIDSTSVGDAWFSGEIELRGATMRHPDPDSREVCFEADSLSGSRLPRWAGDERRAWFCFENRAAAERALGPPSEGVAGTVVIDRFTIHRGLTDEVNSARFVRHGRD